MSADRMHEDRNARGVEVVKRKREMRRLVKARRAALSARERHDNSAELVAALTENQSWLQATTVALFCSMGDEVETEMLVDAAWSTGRVVAFPVAPPLGQPLEFRRVTRETPLVQSRYGALEPSAEADRVDLSAFDLMVIPGLAFDMGGARLGYGGGYYDRTIALATAPAVLVAFSCQQVDCVPEEPHDRRVQGVVTELGWALRAR